ncbi:ubiquitin-conjugating enzyme E2 2 [Striga asiatica]|uniref:Ubiquitin-conjugating enzyme E2 2 n=1 Tax=Striga asiatica TaxID=4170 RepID=A0A5A7QDP0_STRAF|nr:ubiquitin-conjugating enzyme E2 2 [Striga asiatica]
MSRLTSHEMFMIPTPENTRLPELPLLPLLFSGTLLSSSSGHVSFLQSPLPKVGPATNVRFCNDIDSDTPQDLFPAGWEHPPSASPSSFFSRAAAALLSSPSLFDGVDGSDGGPTASASATVTSSENMLRSCSSSSPSNPAAADSTKAMGSLTVRRWAPRRHAEKSRNSSAQDQVWDIGIGALGGSCSMHFRREWKKSVLIWNKNGIGGLEEN